jgi:hypothetical protein
LNKLSAADKEGEEQLEICKQHIKETENHQSKFKQKKDRSKELKRTKGSKQFGLCLLKTT